MDMTDAAAAFAAIGLKARLEILTMLLASGPDGLSAGDIVTRQNALQNSVSTQLKALSHANLVTKERRGRQIVYRANRDVLADLVVLLKC